MPRTPTPRPARRLLGGLLLAACVVAACDDDAIGPDPVSVVSAVVNDEGPIFRSLSLTLSQPADVEVVYWSGTGARLLVRGDSAAGARQVIPLPRLRARSTYNYRVRATGGRDTLTALAEGSFQTGDLPEDLRALSFTTKGAATAPLLFLNVRSTFSGGVIIDGAGNIVWYGRTAVPPQGSTRRANGNYVVMNQGVGLFEFSSMGKIVGFLPQARVAGFPMHHDLTATPRNTILFITFDGRVFNGTRLEGEAIWEWDPRTDVVEKRWSAWDFLDPGVDKGARSIPSDWFHANSIRLGQRGNPIVSFHFTDEILSIAPDFRSIEWRLGGPRSTLNVSAAQRTSGQHSAAEVAPNEILLFDNGYARADGARYSRAIQFRIDPASKAVTTTWEYRPSPDIWASVISGARRLENGNTVVTFGTPAGPLGTGPVALHEVSPQGALVWSVEIGMPPGGTVFRGEPTTSVGNERVVTP